MGRRQSLALAQVGTRATSDRSTLSRAKFEGLTPSGEILIGIRGVVRTALVGTSCSEAELLEAIRERREALVDFIDDDPEQPVVLAILRSRVHVDREPKQTMKQARDNGDEPKALERFVHVEATDGIRFQTGGASIELSSSGRVEIRGVEIVSAAEGTHRILGGSVGIN